MAGEEKVNHECEARDRIASFMRAELHRQKQLGPEEQHTLQTAAARLDQWLAAAAGADRQTLCAATARLEQWLRDIAAGKLPKAKSRARGSTR